MTVVDTLDQSSLRVGRQLIRGFVYASRCGGTMGIDVAAYLLPEKEPIMVRS